MTDLAIAEPGTAPPSTVIDTDTPAGASGGGAPRVIPEDKPEAKAPSLRDIVSDAVKKDTEGQDDDDKDADKAEDKTAAKKGAEKPEADAKAPEAKDGQKVPERGADGKFAAKQAEGEEAKSADEARADEKPAEAKGHIEPPARFLPDAKETWRNTPRPVQRDIDNAFREHEAELAKHREAAERYEPIRHFDEVARQHGRAGVHESLAEVAHLEDMMGKNPLAALNQILLRAGPRKADGQPVSLFELAQAVVQMGPQGYQQAVKQAPQQQPQNDNSEIVQLKAQMARMQEQTLATTVIEPFKLEHPRYNELQDDIALFLKSGKIPATLSPLEKLAAAYDMAVRINPASHAEALATGADPEPGRRADDDLSGSKSIKSAPGAVSPDMEPERGGSISDLLRDELKRAKRS